MWGIDGLDLVRPTLARLAKRLTGYRWLEVGRNGWESRFAWGEVTSGKGLAMALCLFEEHFSLHLHLGAPNIFIPLPFLRRWHRAPREMMESWGFCLDRDDFSALHLNWGHRTKIVHLPWEHDWHRTSYLMADGTWLHERRHDRPGVNPKSPFKTNHDHYRHIRDLRDAGEWRQAFPYTYVRRNGAEQRVTATVTVVERECRQRWLRWTRWRARVVRSIDVAFSQGIGERVDSWKGGVYGTGCDMRANETPEDTLRRMEREMKFT